MDNTFSADVLQRIIPGIYRLNYLPTDELNSTQFECFKNIISIDNDKSVNYDDAAISMPSDLLQELPISFEYYHHNDNYLEIKKITIKDEYGYRNDKHLEILNLNFNEKSVLQNCYKAVKFMNNNLQNGECILFLDYNLNNLQKILTCCIAYLMFKNNIKFIDALDKLQQHFKRVDLDGFYVNQLREYEPILQVLISLNKGTSCARELRAKTLKRKKIHDNNDMDYN